MTPAMILSLTLIAAIFIGGLEWSRADKARARERRRWDRERREHAARAEAAAGDYADAHRYDDPLSEYWERQMRTRGEGGSTSLAAVIIPLAAFFGLVIAWWYR